MIVIYPNRLNNRGMETHAVTARQSLLAWLLCNGIDQATPVDSLPMSLYLNGEQVLPGMWWNTHFGPDDEVEIYREPKGTDPFSITFALIFGAKAVLSALMPKLPNMPGSSSGSGKALGEASAKGNKVKLNDVIPELFGYNPQRYLDYLNLPRRYFAGPKEQRIEMMLGVGMGYYQIQPSSVKVGETSLLSLGDGASFTIYQPGDYVGADPAHYCWYTAPEVGASSTGAAGLELTATTDLTLATTATVFNFEGDTVVLPAGSGTFPDDWEPGLVINVVAPYTYTVTDGTGDGGRDVIGGPIAQHGFVVGDTITIMGDNEGTYTVHALTSTTMQLDYAGGAPGTGLKVGTVVMAMAFSQLRFRIVTIDSSAMVVERLLNDGTADGAWPGWDPLSSNQGQVRLDSSNLEAGYRGPYPAAPAGELVDAIEWDVFYPQGLFGLGREGQFYTIPGQHVFEWRDADRGGGDPWHEVLQIVSDDSQDQQGYTFRIVLPYQMRPECRIRKIATTQGRPEEVHDTVQWYGLRGRILASSLESFPGMTVMSCNIQGGDQISSQSEALVNLSCIRMLPTLRGGVWLPMSATREISAAIGHVVRSVGYSDTKDLNIGELERLESTYWTPRGEWYDKTVTTASTVKDILKEIAQAGMADITVSRGQITPIREGVRGSAFSAMYTPQLMLDPLDITIAMPDQPDDFDGVDVKYYDHRTRQTETVKCRMLLPSGQREAGKRVETIEIEGVGDRTRAWRIGMRRRRSQVYQIEQYEFQTELSALNSELKDYVSLGTTTPGQGQSTYMEGYYNYGGASMIETSAPLDWSKPGVYKVAVRRKDGSVSGPHTATRVDDYVLSIPTPLDFEPDFGGEWMFPVLQFGLADNWCLPAIIEDVSPKGTRSCSVKAVNYDARVYDDDNNFPPAGA
ncbi:tail fiber protein [Pseudomonas phage Psp6]|nr:tail fiber protein [Pseudomonas phage Psp6]